MASIGAGPADWQSAFLAAWIIADAIGSSVPVPLPFCCAAARQMPRPSGPFGVNIRERTSYPNAD
ncbi:MAG TPA: hypothetical protein VGL31_13660 [Xanthobacteraceae bacterium]